MLSTKIASVSLNHPIPKRSELGLLNQTYREELHMQGDIKQKIDENFSQAEESLNSPMKAAGHFGQILELLLENECSYRSLQVSRGEESFTFKAIAALKDSQAYGNDVISKLHDIRLWRNGTIHSDSTRQSQTLKPEEIFKSLREIYTLFSKSEKEYIPQRRANPPYRVNADDNRGDTKSRYTRYIRNISVIVVAVIVLFILCWKISGLILGRNPGNQQGLINTFLSGFTSKVSMPHTPAQIVEAAQKRGFDGCLIVELGKQTRPHMMGPLGSSNESVAKLVQEGEFVEGLSTGEAIIERTWINRYYYYLLIVVENLNDYPELNSTLSNLICIETQNSIRVSRINTNFSYSSSDEGIVSLGENNILYAHSPGIATIKGTGIASNSPATYCIVYDFDELTQ